MRKYILLLIIVLTAAFAYTNRAFFAIDECLDGGVVGLWGRDVQKQSNKMKS